MSFKKANMVSDTILWIVFTFVFILLIVIGKNLLSTLNDDIQASDEFDSRTKNMTQTMDTNYAGFFDKIFLFFIILLTILTIVASYMIDATPIFFIISFLALASLIIVGASLSNVYDDFSSDPALSDAVSQFPIINWFMDKIVLFIVVVGFLIGMALYAKSNTI